MTQRMMYALSTKQYVDEHLDEKISLEMLAGNCGLSVYHFCREFKRETGCSPKQYVIRRKLEIAEELLSETDLKICEVAEQIGYEPAQFSSLYKAQTGISPNAWRVSAAC